MSGYEEEKSHSDRLDVHELSFTSSSSSSSSSSEEDRYERDKKLSQNKFHKYWKILGDNITFEDKLPLRK